MESEDFETVLMSSLKQTTFEVEGSTPVPAEDVLLDFKSPVFRFDRVGRSSCSVAHTQCRCLYFVNVAGSSPKIAPNNYCRW